jgi:hypothetical protein
VRSFAPEELLETLRELFPHDADKVAQIEKQLEKKAGEA